MKLPCIDCITYAICKAYQSKYPEAHMRGMFITIIESRCSLISAYTRGRYAKHEDGIWELDTTSDVLDFFYQEGKYAIAM